MTRTKAVEVLLDAERKNNDCSWCGNWDGAHLIDCAFAQLMFAFDRQVWIDVHGRTELFRKPTHWECEFDWYVVDPDGWRTDNTDWTQPMSRVEYERRASLSTVRLKPKGI